MQPIKETDIGQIFENVYQFLRHINAKANDVGEHSL